MHTHSLRPSLSLAHLNLSSTVKFLLEKLQERKRERKTSFARTLLLSSSLLMLLLLLLLLRRKKRREKSRGKILSEPEKRRVCVRACARSRKLFLLVEESLNGLQQQAAKMTEVRLWLHAIIIIVSVFLLPHVTFQWKRSSRNDVRALKAHRFFLISPCSDAVF